MKHSKEIRGFETKQNKPLKELARLVGDLHYDSLREFLEHLSDKLTKDIKSDLKSGREKLAHHLHEANQGIITAEHHIRCAWNISKPFMPEGEWKWKSINYKEQGELRVHWCEQLVFEFHNENGKVINEERRALMACKKDTLEVVVIDWRNKEEHLVPNGSKSTAYAIGNKLK